VEFLCLLLLALTSHYDTVSGLIRILHRTAFDVTIKSGWASPPPIRSIKIIDAWPRLHGAEEGVLGRIDYDPGMPTPNN
jgi:hypothetical protein